MMGESKEGAGSPAVSYRELCRTCLWLGLTAYGGPAMVGYVRDVVVDRRRWVSSEQFAEGVALCQVVPGATLTQVISYTGYLLRGPAGAAAAAGCFILPGALLVLLISVAYFRWQTLPIVQGLSHGVAAVVVAILAYACWRLARTSLPNARAYGIAIIACAAYLARVNAFLVVLGAAGAAYLVRPRQAGEPAPVALPPDAARSVRGTTWAALAFATLATLLGTWSVSPRLARLCLAFLGIGSVAFGGGYSMIPLIQQQVVDSLGLLSTRVFMDGIALGQITPGPIMLTATFIGFAAAGAVGALLATVAIFSPSWVILVLSAPRFQAWSRRGAAQVMIQGVVASFVGMLLSILIRFGRVAFTDLASILLSMGALVALLLKVDLPLVVGAGLLLSAVLFH